MRGALIKRVDPWHLAGRGGAVEGVLGAGRLGRLGAMATPLGGFDISLRFDRMDGQAAAVGAAVMVRLSVRGRVQTVCQRCLEPLDLPVEVDGTVLVARSDAEARALDGDTEALVVDVGEMLELDDLVQDEVMLALPFAPRHEPGECASHDHHKGDRIDGASAHDDQTDPVLAHRNREVVVEPEEKRTNNPFAVLAALQGGDGEEN